MEKKSVTNEPLIKSANEFPVVGIGASAGGLDAFKKFIKAIPESSGMAYVLVQHLAPNHESLLPELLQKVTNVPVLQIADDMKILPDHIYIIPGNKLLIANDDVLQLSPRPALSGTTTNERNLPIDLFFTSLAEVHQSHSIGVVLSGTASDGTRGLKAIKEQGGITFAQDEASAAYDGMPNSAVQAGVVDFILPPEKIPQKLLELTKIINDNGGGESQFSSGQQTDEDVFKQMLALLRIRRGTDFTYYKQTTIRRRILRRMALSKNEEPAAYLTHLRENKQEQDILYQDLLIPVTEFFRDKKSFDNLCETVFPNIIKNKINGETIRIWVAGCSTGEEAYSIAICFKEYLANNNNDKVQIFATDISEPAIAKARTGIYKKTDVETLSPQRLGTFFTKNYGDYRINKEIRDMCVFAVHNFLRDPPFGKMDFISCRNVLIYMEPYLQKRALTTFHYALNPKKFLLLGKSETTSSVPDLFASAAKSDKLFSRKDVPGKFIQVSIERSEQNSGSIDTNSKAETIQTDFQKTADDILLNKYSGVVINEAMDVVHFRGKTSDYLEQPQGRPTTNLLKIAKQGLAFELRNILHKAKKDKSSVIKENIAMQANGSLRSISIEAIPLPNTIEPYYLVLFHDGNANGSTSPQENHSASNEKESSAKTKKDDKDLRIVQLELELAQIREDMRSITEDQEAANEELQSANEELLSGSEELQSLNEELATGKEELQSTNEELIVVNQEMIDLNEQVTAALNYSENIIANIREPLLVLDKNLRIKTVNNSFYKTFQVNEKETEGVLIYDIGNRQWDIPALRILLEKILPEKSKFNDFEVKHNFSAIGERIMLLNAREIINIHNTEKLILLSIEDVTERVAAHKNVEESEKRYNMMVMQSPFAFAVLKGKDMVVTLANDSVKEMWGKGKNVEGKPLIEVLPEIKDQPFPALLKEVYTTGIPYTTYETLTRLVRNGKMEDVYFNFVYQAYREADETISGVVIIATEVTSQAEFNKKIKESENLYHELSLSLEQKVNARTEEINKINHILEEKNTQLTKINKELEAFTYVSSHDLQEPLRKIQTFAGRILEKENQNLSDTGRGMFNRMREASGRMQTLIHDLLAFARLGTTERKFETTDLNIIIEEVKRELNEAIEEKQASIEVKGLCEINIIPFQFRQLMYNLIGNALKFSNPKIPPYITIESRNIQNGKANANLEPNKEYCHIIITDNGIGFEKEYSEKIFDVFQKLHGKEEYAGTGIGLAIVKKIVENHNGIITATSKLNKGTRFDIYIPA